MRVVIYDGTSRGQWRRIKMAEHPKIPKENKNKNTMALGRDIPRRMKGLNSVGQVRGHCG